MSEILDAIWAELSETQQASIKRMASMERGWHYASVVVRTGGEDHSFDATWLRKILRHMASLPWHEDV